MHLHPKDENYPHPAILHAIVSAPGHLHNFIPANSVDTPKCASASRWASQEIATLPDGTRRDKFADLHVSKTRAYIDRTMATGQDIFPVMQACIILSWYFYQEGRWVEVWIFAGFQTRAAVPLRLNYPGTFSPIGAASPGAYLAPPKDLKDLESRRRTWWMTVLFDRIASVGGWVHAVDERDIGTELPLRRVDFEHDVGFWEFGWGTAERLRHFPDQRAVKSTRTVHRKRFHPPPATIHRLIHSFLEVGHDIWESHRLQHSQCNSCRHAAV